MITAYNPMLDLNAEVPKAILEIGFILGVYFLVNKIKEVLNDR
jgi:hypothetical protein